MYIHARLSAEAMNGIDAHGQIQPRMKCNQDGSGFWTTSCGKAKLETSAVPQITGEEIEDRLHETPQLAEKENHG